MRWDVVYEWDHNKNYDGYSNLRKRINDDLDIMGSSALFDTILVAGRLLGVTDCGEESWAD